MLGFSNRSGETFPTNTQVHIGRILRCTERKVHMDYEQFKEEFIDAVKERLEEQGSDMNVERIRERGQEAQ